MRSIRRPRPPVLELEHLVLGAVFLLFAGFYVWQVSRRVSPTLFTDELELTQISRAIADVGHPERRGVSYGFTTIVPWLTAPFWWIESVSQAYGAIKGFQAIVMAGAIFPAYGIARFVLDRRVAVVAAAASIAVPALSYSSILVEEPFAYPIATLALFLTLRAAERRTVGAFALAGAGAILALATRSQLSVMLLVVAIAAVVSAWGSDRVVRWRRAWTAWDRIGAVVIGIGIVFVLNSVASRASDGVARHDPALEGAHLGLRRLGRGSLGDRRRGRPGRRAARRPRPSPAWPRSADAGIHDRRRRGDGLAPLVRRPQGRVPLDHLLEPRRRAEPHVPLAPRDDGDARRARVPRRPVVGVRTGGSRSSVTRSRPCRPSSRASRTTRPTGSRSSRSRTASSRGRPRGSTRRSSSSPASSRSCSPSSASSGGGRASSEASRRRCWLRSSPGR